MLNKKKLTRSRVGLQSCIWRCIAGFVATATRTNELLPPILGMLFSTVERLLRALREAGLLPFGKPGGGKGSAHYDAYHLAYILLGLAGLAPSDAPEAVLALRSLPFFGPPSMPEGVKPPLPTLEDQLADWIKGAGAARRHDATWFLEDKAVLQSWTMQLCLNPLHALITIQPKEGEDEIQILYAADPEASVPGVRRLTVISGDVLLAVGELLADTEKQLATSTPSFLDQARANASLESKSAGHPCQRVPTLSGDQPRANETGSVLRDLPKVSAKSENFKDAALAGLVTAPLTAS